MIKILIPGRSELLIKHIVFDFNGTLATEGKPDEPVKELLTELKEYAKIHILTADTYGTAESECEKLGVLSVTLSGEECGKAKKDYVEKLGIQHTACVGNGENDVPMFEIAVLSVAVIGNEGCCVKALNAADLAVNHIRDALLLFINPARLKASLRT